MQIQPQGKKERTQPGCFSPAGATKKMQQQTKYISHPEPRDYDFTDDKGKQIVGTSFKMGVWTGKQSDLPGEVKIKDAKVDKNIRNLGLEPLDDIIVTFEVSESRGRIYAGKVIAVDRVEDMVPA